MDFIVRKADVPDAAPRSSNQTDAQGRRTIQLQVEAETVGDGQLKHAIVSGGSTSPFEAYCDEGEFLGGTNSAPSPLAYVSLGIAF